MNSHDEENERTPPELRATQEGDEDDEEESNDGLLHIRLRRLPEDSEIRIRVDPDGTFDDVSRTVGRTTGQSGPFRFVFRGKLVDPKTPVATLEVTEGESIYLLRAPMPRDAPADEGSRGGGGGLIPEALSNDPVFQMLTEDSSLFMSLLDANPRIRALRDRSPEFDSLLGDAQLVRQLFRASRSPSMARELVRASDRAISRIDVIPGGMDALRQIYQDIHDPMFESFQMLGSEDDPDNESGTEPIPEEKIHEIADDPFPGGDGSSTSANNHGGPSLSDFASWMDPEEGPPGVPHFPPLRFGSGDARPPSFAGALAAAAALSSSNYESQLDTLEQMGFPDREKNLDALRRHGGNLNRAIDDLVAAGATPPPSE